MKRSNASKTRDPINPTKAEQNQIQWRDFVGEEQMISKQEGNV